MKNTFLCLCLLFFIFSSCQKTDDLAPTPGSLKQISAESAFVKYTIKGGQHSSDLNPLTKVEYEELRFIVKFDSSAIYTSLSPANQFDINKLFGFSDNNAHHHQFSARFGWNYGKNGLSLFAYVYNNGMVQHKLLGTIVIGQEYQCAIHITADKYIFILNDKSETMPRASTTTKSVGYKLYPYFGGDEMAPHDVTILIKEVGKI